MKKLLPVTVLCILIAALLISAGCGKKTKTTTPRTTENAVKIANFTFSPDTVTVTAGMEITWTNEDSTVHTVTGIDFDSGEIKPGQSYKHTFSSPGTYDYVCSIHPSMKGKVIVTGESSSDTEPTIPEPPTPPGY